MPSRKGVAWGNVLLCLLACPILQALQGGGMSGTVVDPAGRPAAGLTVYAFRPDRVGERVGTLATSDAEGHFLISGLAPGKYNLSACNEAEGYPDRIYYFYETTEPFPEVEVQPEEVTSGVMVRLGPKGGWVVGRVIDSETGRGLRVAGIIFYRADSTQEFMEGGPNALVWDKHATDLSQFKILVPSNKPFRMKVTAPGRETWYYSPDGTEQHAAAIRLAPGQTKEVVVPLRPTKK